METYEVPARFWQDHLDRDCRCHEDCPDKDTHQADTGQPTSKGYRVVLTDLDKAELLSDADYYSDAVQMMGSEYIGLQASARATVKRLTG
jgi:hypothetical protein